MKSFKVIYQDPLVSQVTEVIRVITVGAFRRRLTVAEKVAINTSEDPVVLVLKEDLFSSDYVDLDFTQLQEGLAYLASVGILQSFRVAELLTNGTQEEKP